MTCSSCTAILSVAQSSMCCLTQATASPEMKLRGGSTGRSFCLVRKHSPNLQVMLKLNHKYTLRALGYTVKPLLRDHPDERPPPLERPLDNVNLYIKVLISTPDERPPLLKGHFSDAKGVASQEGFHCIYISSEGS